MSVVVLGRRRSIRRRATRHDACYQARRGFAWKNTCMYVRTHCTVRASVGRGLQLHTRTAVLQRHHHYGSASRHNLSINSQSAGIRSDSSWQRASASNMFQDVPLAKSPAPANLETPRLENSVATRIRTAAKLFRMFNGVVAS